MTDDDEYLFMNLFSFMKGCLNLWPIFNQVVCLLAIVTITFGKLFIFLTSMNKTIFNLGLRKLCQMINKQVSRDIFQSRTEIQS